MKFRKLPPVTRLINVAKKLEFLGDGCGYFLDRFRGRIHPAYAFSSHEVFGLLDFTPAIVDIRILAVRSAFIADFPKSFGMYR